ncbi:hypothetical protein DL765_004920 [Monosporascus sp. GIB2]|nr:hypothetical protein DL765_004920 [Monosporascus sp. GIB2]
MLLSTARAQFLDDAETEESDFDCLGGTNLNCELNNFSDLRGHAEPSPRHGGGSETLTLDPDWAADGTVYLFAKEDPAGGLSLGEIRILKSELINECDVCGSISRNWLSRDESQLGWVEIDRRDPAVCQPPCVDAERDPNNATDEDEPPAGSRHVGIPYADFHGGSNCYGWLGTLAPWCSNRDDLNKNETASQCGKGVDLPDSRPSTYCTSRLSRISILSLYYSFKLSVTARILSSQPAAHAAIVSKSVPLLPRVADAHPIYLRAARSPWRQISQQVLTALRSILAVYLTVVLAIVLRYKPDDTDSHTGWRILFQFPAVSFVLLWAWHLLMTDPGKGLFEEGSIKSFSTLNLSLVSSIVAATEIFFLNSICRPTPVAGHIGGVMLASALYLAWVWIGQRLTGYAGIFFLDPDEMSGQVEAIIAACIAFISLSQGLFAFMYGLIAMR